MATKVAITTAKVAKRSPIELEKPDARVRQGALRVRQVGEQGEAPEEIAHLKLCERLLAGVSDPNLKRDRAFDDETILEYFPANCKCW